MAGWLFNKGESALMNFCVLWKLGIVFTKTLSLFFSMFCLVGKCLLLLVVVVVVVLVMLF